MKKIIALYSVAFFSLLSLNSCDKEFNEIGTDIVGEDHYEASSQFFDVKAYNQKLGPVATNNLSVNPLGRYVNPAFGTTDASFVTQLELNSVNPVFYKTDLHPTLPNFQLPVVDSVALNVPYFNRLIENNTDGTKTYALDSIYGVASSKFKLEVLESGYFLRDLDPTEQFTTQQVFYNDIQSEIEQNLINATTVLNNNTSRPDQNNQFFFDAREHKLEVKNGVGEVISSSRTVPSMRLNLDKNFFLNKIINAPSGSLSTNVAFKNYFRGLYFKVSNFDNPGSMAYLNFRAGVITMYYTEDVITPDNPATTAINEAKRERVSKNLRINLNGNTVSLLNNSDNTDYLSNANNSSQEASKLYLKGGEGAIAIIDLFNANELAQIRAEKWLINEANLSFYIDRAAMNNAATIEPRRLFLYDLNNNRPLVDYQFDQTTSFNSKQNKFVHGGLIEKENVANGRGTKYKIRLTYHINNLVKYADSTNIRLGLVITDNINDATFAKLKTPIVTSNGTIKRIPKMAALNQLGTILYGSNIPVGNQDYDKRIKLQIYYTKPD
jgi:hypothetical protein